jgi:hypothetical protein
LQLYPDQPELLTHSGFVHLHAQRYVDEESDLSAALARGLHVPDLHYGLALARFMLLALLII